MLEQDYKEYLSKEINILINLLIGGSPRTYWSIAKNKGRDVNDD